MTKNIKALLAALVFIVFLESPFFYYNNTRVLYSSAESSNITSDGMTFSAREGKEKEVALVSYIGQASDIVVPEKINGHKVTAIGDKVFYDCNTLKSVKLPDTINFFGSEVFRNSSVIDINIPTSLKVIPSYCFNNCQNLEKVLFHDEIAIIANTAFKKTNISIPDSLREKVTGALITSSNTSVKFASDVWDYLVVCTDGDVHAEISGYKGSENDITIPEKFGNIEVTAFNGVVFPNLNSIKRIVFPTGITDLPMSFANSEIEEVVLNNICSIPRSAFSDCKSLKKVVAKGSFDKFTIGNEAFKGCTMLDQVPLPSECRHISIGNNAFQGAGIVEASIEFSSDIGRYAFDNCDALKSVSLVNASVDNRAFSNCNDLRNVTLSGEVFLDDMCFSNCAALENIDIAGCYLSTDKATSFNNCPKLMTLNSEKVFDSSIGDYKSVYHDFVFEHFHDADEVGFVNEYVLFQVNRVVKENITTDMTDIEKVAILHDWVCKNTNYADDELGDRDNHNDASIFMNDDTVCEGYARACNLLYHAAGLETYFVDNSNHAWNIVKVGEHFFHIDTTWDDGETALRDWFLKSDSEMRKAGGSHAEWSVLKPSSLHSFQNDVLPPCKYAMGDINTDETVNVADLVLLQKAVLGKYELSENNWVLADVCSDGKINSFDLVAMRKKVISLLE